ncbi:MAG: hypothetical protein Kow006_09600 [Gammaproteobacteria bacterium]
MSKSEMAVRARWVDDALRQMADGALAATGVAFLRRLTHYLSRALGFDYCFVGRVEESDANSITAVASASNGNDDEPYSFDFRDTPCENVVGKKLCYYPSRVDQIFPKDHWLSEAGITSYIGVPLFDSSRKPQGVISGMSRTPLAHPETAQSLLQLFAPRVSAELERMEAETALRMSEQRMRSLFEAIFEGVVIHRNGRIVEVNPAMANLVGRNAETLLGQELFTLFTPESRSQVTSCVENDNAGSREVVGIGQGGKHCHWEIINRRIEPERDGDSIMAIRDISERKRHEEELRYRATHDLLTGLPNRTLFLDRLQQAIADSFRSDRQFALHYIDLDGFKEINDRYGHAKGDEVLKRVGQVLKHGVRNTDTVARIGGDEFTVIQRDLNGTGDATHFARKLLGRLNEINNEAFCECRVSASIGIVMFPDEQCSLDTLLEKADTAMYTAKRGGPGEIRFYSPSSTGLPDAFIEGHGVAPDESSAE